MPQSPPLLYMSLHEDLWGLHSSQFRGIILPSQALQRVIAHQTDPVINTHPAIPNPIINIDAGQLALRFSPQTSVLFSPLQLVCLFVGCSWVLFWPPAPHVFLIATIVVKMRYYSVFLQNYLFCLLVCLCLRAVDKKKIMRGKVFFNNRRKHMCSVQKAWKARPDLIDTYRETLTTNTTLLESHTRSQRPQCCQGSPQLTIYHSTLLPKDHMEVVWVGSLKRMGFCGFLVNTTSHTISYELWTHTPIPRSPPQSSPSCGSKEAECGCLRGVADAQYSSSCLSDIG